MDKSEVNDSLTRDRAIRIFTYFKELARLRTRITRDLSSYDQVVWFHRVPEHKDCFSILSPESGERQDGVWLEIRRPKEPQKPAAPSSCSRWLDHDSDADPFIEPKLRDEIPTSDASTRDSSQDPQLRGMLFSDQFERLSDHPGILQEWHLYIQNDWLPWSKAYAPWKAANDLYFELFSIHEQQKKLGERYELLLGLGLLTWETPTNQIIRRHVVVGDAYLTFDADRAKFQLRGAPDGIKLRFETEMVEAAYLPSLEQQERTEDLLTPIQDSPWDQAELDKLLRSWIQSLSPDGTYFDSLVPPDKCTNVPTVTFAPAIILRQRTQRSQVQCFTNIVEQISNGGNIPLGVQLLCERPENVPPLGDSEMWERAGGSEDNTLYLPLAINGQQLQILGQIRNRQGILVQGPPGTGKSHTIANLVCHLLAQGKRVLVTSQTPRALRVLKDKMPDEVKALCVTLLGNDQAARRELEGSVQKISQQYSEWNPIRSRESIEALKLQLFEIEKHVAQTNRLLREMREIDSYQHQVAGGTYRGTAQQIAQQLRKEEGNLGWLTDDIGENEPCHLSNLEFMEILQFSRELSDDYCRELRRETVSREDVSDIASFVKMVDDEKTAKQNVTVHSPRRQSFRFHILEQVPEDDIGSLHSSISGLVAATGSIKNRFAWVPQALSDMLSGNDTPWKGLRDFMVGHLSGLREKVTTVQAIAVQFPDSLDRRMLRADAQDLLHHLEKGGKLGWRFLAPHLVRRTRYLTKEVRVNGQACSTPDTLTLLVTYLDVLDGIEYLWSALQGKDSREEGSLVMQVGYLEERLEALEEVIALEGYLQTAKTSVAAVKGLAEPQWHSMQELEDTILDLEAVESEHTYRRATSIIEDIIQRVRIVASSSAGHDLNQGFLAALEERDTDAFAQCLDGLRILETDRQRLLRRETLHERLSLLVPKLSRQLQSTFNDSVWDQRAGEFEAAWAWKQANQWLTRFDSEHDNTKLETGLEQLSEEERRTITSLAAAKAWQNCMQGMTESQRGSLVAWAKTIKRGGKWTGKYAPMLRRQAQQFMDECKRAIPAWIMPLYRVFETVDPEPESFDVIIIDEASQTGPEGLVIQYLGRQCIVVGDDKQISPEAEFVEQSAVNSLIEKYLHDIPFHDRYDLQTSLFDQGDIRFRGRIVLREHFRSVPEIIQFSNDLCYAETPLKPLRQYSPERLDPIMVRHVKDGFREGGSGRHVNQREADTLVDTLVEFCSREEYADKTMGVISLQGEAQGKLIESKLLTRLSPAELERRRMVCGDAYAFQGDERDVIFLSMVAAPNETIGALTRGLYERRFNVAASRARDQMVLFHTATLNDLHPDCMRHRLLEYCLNPVSKTHEVNLDICDSQFEKDVCQAIISKGYRVFPQYEVAGYHIDLVVQGPRSELAIECDGDDWHGIEQYEKDVIRQRVLERCRWRFWRIRGSEYYRDPEGSLESLWQVLSEMEIHPVGKIGLDKENPRKHDRCNMADDIQWSSPSTIGIGVVDTSARQEEEETIPEKPAPPESDLQWRETQEPKAENAPRRVVESEIYNYPPDFFFRLAKEAKDTGMLNPWQRKFVFDIGKYRARGWQISEKQERQALRIIKIAIEAGFS